MYLSLALESGTKCASLALVERCISLAGPFTLHIMLHKFVFFPHEIAGANNIKTDIIILEQFVDTVNFFLQNKHCYITDCKCVG